LNSKTKKAHFCVFYSKESDSIEDYFIVETTK